MTTQEVADRFHQLATENKWNEIQDELYSKDAESIEPPKAASQGMNNAKGIDAIKKKAEDFAGMIEETFSGFTSKPVVAGNFFSVAMGLDVTMKGAGRTQMDEIGVYEVKDGKIVKEQFFF